jgi:tetratricopeptide (TPR) repeat protein
MTRHVNERSHDGEAAAARRDAAYRHAQALVSLGEPKTAVDLMRGVMNAARASLPPASLELFRALTQYAGILESAAALPEAEYIQAEALDIVSAAQLTTQEAVLALLAYGLLLHKMHNYAGALAALKDAVARADALQDVDELDRQIILAQAWRGQSQAYEALGEFTEASNALDVFMGVKRSIRFLAFAPARER